jgi:UrcA family protein
MIKGLLLLAGLAIASGTQAQPGTHEAAPQSETVTFGDLNVASSSDQTVLRHRIQAAAGRVCDIGGMASLEDFHTSAQCYRLSYKAGLRQMNQILAARRGSTAVAVSAIVVTANMISLRAK